MSRLFQLNDAEELDFGFYRIIKRHNRKVREFLGEIDPNTGNLNGGELAAILENSFQQLENDTTREKKETLQKLGRDLELPAHLGEHDLEMKLLELEKIRKLQEDVARYRSLRAELLDNHSAESDRTEVLNRLYEFYARHYQDGDFIVQRRYGRNGARYIKSTGDDTEFHWATEDMYYIKSGDVFTDYPVVLSSGQRIVFTVAPESLQKTRADLKPTDRAHYRLLRVVLAEKSKKSDFRVELQYLKGTQTKARLDEIVKAVQDGTGVAAEVISRHLRRFVARNQADFFIHQRLRETLDEDLDIFLKTEVLNADQLLAEGATVVAARALRVARVIRLLAQHINAFLGVLADHQKRLWEKKKLVLDTRYVITLDRINRDAPTWLAEHIDRIVAVQRGEWRELGLGDFSDAAACRRITTGDLVNAAIERYLPLPVDTGNFKRKDGAPDNDFKWSLLTAVTATRSLDDALDGVAIHSDNWQALNTLQAKYRNRVKCIYIDPPYNTGGDGFPYKDAYQHASWMAMISTRLQLAAPYLQRNGALFASIDHVERHALAESLSRVFGQRNRVEEIIWGQNTTKNQSPTYSTNHEYVQVWSRDLAAVSADERMFREPKPGASEMLEMAERLNPDYPSVAKIEAEINTLFDQHQVAFRETLEEQGVDYDKTLDPWKGLLNYSHAEYRDAEGRYVPENEARIRKASIWIWREDNPSMPSGKQSESTRNPADPNFRFYNPIHPDSGKAFPHPKRGWGWPQHPDSTQPNRSSFWSQHEDSRIVWGDLNSKKSKIPQLKTFLHEVSTQVSKSVVLDYTDGEKELTSFTGKTNRFPNPKPTTLIERFILQTSDADDYVMDFFAGSGTTWHSALSAFHDDRQRRRVLLIEGGQHFESVLLPRIQCTAASWVWKNGKPTALNGPGAFLRVQQFEQYEDTLENLAADHHETASLFDGAEALAYELDDALEKITLDSAKFIHPVGATLKRIVGAETCAVPVDLVESLIYFLGLSVDRLYREENSVVITGRRNGSGETVSVLWRDNVLHDAAWLQSKMMAHPADRIYTNEPGLLVFSGAERLSAIETVFVEAQSGQRGVAW